MLACVASWLSGCGYHFGFRAPANVTTIAVPIFQNATGSSGRGSRRELELDLTAAVVREIQRRTHLRIVGADRADVIIRGQLDRFDERVSVEGNDDAVLQTSATVAVTVFVERRGGTTRERHLAEAVELTPGTQTAGTPSALLRDATTEAFSRIGERIVMLLEALPAER